MQEFIAKIALLHNKITKIVSLQTNWQKNNIRAANRPPIDKNSTVATNWQNPRQGVTWWPHGSRQATCHERAAGDLPRTGRIGGDMTAVQHQQAASPCSAVYCILVGLPLPDESLIYSRALRKLDRHGTRLVRAIRPARSPTSPRTSVEMWPRSAKFTRTSGARRGIHRTAPGRANAREHVVVVCTKGGSQAGASAVASGSTSREHQKE